MTTSNIRHSRPICTVCIGGSFKSTFPVSLDANKNNELVRRLNLCWKVTLHVLKICTKYEQRFKFSQLVGNMRLCNGTLCLISTLSWVKGTKQGNETTYKTTSGLWRHTTCDVIASTLLSMAILYGYDGHLFPRSCIVRRSFYFILVSIIKKKPPFKTFWKCLAQFLFNNHTGTCSTNYLVPVQVVS